jgi:prepilin-type processing-associated H-X9-DG protein
MINPPDAQNSSDKFLGESERGWGFSCRNRFYDTAFSMTDVFAPRFPSGGNVVFVDGHTKLLGAQALAVGTNFDVMRGCELTKVTDRTKYLWDIRGSAAPLE